MTPEELNAAVKRIAELDAKRTQGEWWQIAADKSFCVYEDGFAGPTIGKIENDNDRIFAVHAPLMAQVIAQQDARIKELEAVLVKAGEAIRHGDASMYGISLKKEALASINTVLGRE